MPYVARPIRWLGRSSRSAAAAEVLPGGGATLPPNTDLDTSAAAGGLDGFLGNYDPDYVELTEAVLIVGVRLATSDGTFTTLDVGDEDDPPEATLQVTCSAIFGDDKEAQSKLSASPYVDISDGTWSGSAAIALDHPVLLTPGKYRIDFAATLSESYEFDKTTLPEIDVVLVPARFEKLEATTDDGVLVCGLRCYTDYVIGGGELWDPETTYDAGADVHYGGRAWTTASESTGDIPTDGSPWTLVTTGALTKSYYEFPGSDEPPIAVDLETYRMSLVDWCAYLFERAIIGLGEPSHPHRRTWLTNEGYIDDRWQAAIQALPGYNVYGYDGDVAGGGVTDTQQTVGAAIMDILWELGAALDWTGPTARIIVLPRSTPAYVRLIGIDDIARKSDDDPDPEIEIAYTNELEIINTIDARYMRDYSQSPSFQAYPTPHPRVEDAESVAVKSVGRRSDPPKFWFDWIRDTATMAEVAAVWRTHHAKPKKLVQITGYLDLLELQRGDVIAFDLTPNITIGPDPGTPGENQGVGDDGVGDGGVGGSPIVPPQTFIGEKFDGLTPAIRFMIDTAPLVNWDAKRVQIHAREVP